MGEKDRTCPQCQSTEIEHQHLGTKGSAWPVTFGSVLFQKKELLAYACKKCGFVFLYLGGGMEEASGSD